HTHRRTDARTHAGTYTHTHTKTHTQTQTHKPTTTTQPHHHTHTHIHTHTHTHTYTNTYINTARDHHITTLITRMNKLQKYRQKKNVGHASMQLKVITFSQCVHPHSTRRPQCISSHL